MKTRFPKALMIAVTWCLWLVVIEYGARYWIQHRGDALERARRVMEYDRELGWRDRRNLATTFEGHDLFTDANGFRVGPKTSDRAPPTVLVLGPSSAFGWGVADEETWPRLLEKKLRESGREATVLNTSQIGFTLEQGRRLWRSLANTPAAQAQTVVIAYGVNETDRWRFFADDSRSDREWLSNLQASQVPSFLENLAMYSLGRRAWHESKIFRGCGLTQIPLERELAQDFLESLHALNAELKSLGKNVVVLDSARHFPFPPDEARAERSEDLLRQSLEASQKGDCAGSRRLFFASRVDEPWRVMRDIDRLNQAVAAMTRAENIPFASVSELLSGEGAWRKEFFVDTIHLSYEGNQKASELIRDVMLGNKHGDVQYERKSSGSGAPHDMVIPEVAGQPPMGER